MIVLDLETSGLDMINCGIWQIGAIDLETKEEFLEEARIDDEDTISEGSLKITGKIEEELRDVSRQSQKKLLQNFLRWVSKRKIKNFICQNPQFDLSWLNIRVEKYGLEKTYHYRALDLHTIAQLKYKEINKKFLIKDGHSDMNLSKILELCGMKEERMMMEKNKVVTEGKPHGAMEDCRLEGECFSRLIYGKNIFPEFSKFLVPEVLKK
ncbi:MAG: 3'-5' exoribonuclease [Nanoarchaeota archaeon]